MFAKCKKKSLLGKPKKILKLFNDKNSSVSQSKYSFSSSSSFVIFLKINKFEKKTCILNQGFYKTEIVNL